MMRTSLLCCSLTALAGCVTTGTYQAKVSELEGTRREALRTETDLRRELEQERTTSAGRERRLQAELQVRQEQAKALVAELNRRLGNLGEDNEKLADQRGELTAALLTTRVRLDEMTREAAEAQSRAEIFGALAERLTAMIDSGQLDVILRAGRMLIVLPGDVLFDSGTTAVKPSARTALKEIAAALGEVAELEDRSFLVVGHTDDVPIRKGRYPSNWELSTARALAVARVLMGHGVPARRLGVAGHGQHEPLVPNDSHEHRALNRRIEIVLEPNLSELPALEPGEELSAERTP